MAAWQVVLTTVKDVITASAGIVAIIGINAWKRQLRAKTDYELARRLLRAAYGVRDTLNSIRSPITTDTEARQAEKEAGLQPDPTDAESKRAVYKARFGLLNKPLSELQAEVLEAEVSWGSSIRDSVVPLNKCILELKFAVEDYLGQFGTEGRKLERDRRLEVEAAIWRLRVRSEDDKFERTLNAAIARIEEFLKPHLRL